MLAITVRFRVRTGFERPFLDRVREQARASLHAEPACRQFDVCCSSSDPADVFLYELYDTAADFAAHLETPHFAAFDAETRAWVDEKTVHRWDRLEAAR